MSVRFQFLSLTAATLLLTLTSPQLFLTGKFEPMAVRAQTQQDWKVEEFRLYQEGVKQFKENRYREALQSFEQALAIAQTMNDLDRQGRTLNYIGFVYFTLEEYPAALEAYEQALIAYRKIDDGNGKSEVPDDSVYKDDEAKVLNNIGSVYSSQGDYQLALQFYQQALDIALKTGNRGIEGKALNNLGQVYSSLGEYPRALELLQQALALRSQVVDNSGAGVNQYNIGLIYFQLGDDSQALDFFGQALTLVKRRNDKAGEIRVLNVIGNVYSQREENELALNFYQQALAIAQTIDKPSLKGATLNNIAKVRANLEQYEVALDFYQQALDIYQQVNQKAGQGKILDNIGETYFQMGEYPIALGYYQQALAISQAVGNKAETGESLSHIGYLLEQQNQPELAIVFLKQAVNITETIRQDIRQLPSELQQSYTDSVADTYRRLADLLLQQDRILEAQRILDLLKVQELQDYLQDVRGNANTTQGVLNTPPERQIWSGYEDLTDRAIALGQELAQLRQIPSRTPVQEKRVAELVTAQQELTRHFNTFINSPEVLALVEELSPATRKPDLADDLEDLVSLQDNLRNLQQNAVLFYPLILEDRLELILVTPDSPPIRRTVKVKKEELNAAILEFRQHLQNPTRDATKVAQQLYTWLVKPLEADLTAAQAKTLLYAPDGQLRYIPLAALHDGDRWLVERFRINNITAASLTDLNTQPQAKLKILAGAFANVSYPVQMGDSEFVFRALPYAGTEVETLAATIPSTTSLVDTAFSRAATIPQMDDYNIVHFATHGAFVVGSPQDSFILFGDGEIATLAEIKNWSLRNVDLVVLSACQTGLGGELGNGDEILGLGYQFQRAGARATLASLWSVDDGGTQVLMNSFYQALQQSGMTKVEALRQAQLALIESDSESTGENRGLVAVRSRQGIEPGVADRLNHPYYWAPFILIGNGL